MTIESMFKGAAIGLVAGIVTLLIILFARAHDRAEGLARAQNELCRSRERAIASLLEWSTNPNELSQGDIRTRARFDIADPTITKLCLDAETPVSFNEAVSCWIGNAEPRCYADPLRELLQFYRQRKAK